MSTMYAVCGILQHENGLFYSVSRKHDRNSVGFIGGKVEDGEKYSTAMIRECLEETGILCSILPNFPYIANENEFTVSCYMLKIISSGWQRHNITEEGLVSLRPMEDFIDKSKCEFYEYNYNAFKHFGFIK